MSNDSIKEQIDINFKTYHKIKKIIMKEKSPLERIKLIKSAAEFASINFTGYFSDAELENFVLEYAIIPQQQQNNFETSSILHVFTECYHVGGHTRLAYWAIKSLPEYQHYVVIINQTIAIPAWLKSILQDRLIILNAQDNFLQKAEHLQQISMNKEIIILYTHMYDPVPLLAYGTPLFNRPVLYYNHADHLFWLGVSISDCVLDLSLDGQELSLKSRGVTKSEICPVPIEIPEHRTPKDYAKLKLGIPLDKFVIISTGSAYKFETKEYSLLDFALKYYDSDNFMFIFIGPSPASNVKWRNAEKISKGNIKAMGIIKDLIKFNLYLDAADLYIDSYPIGSLTATLQAILRDNLPVLCVKNLISYDILKNSYAFVGNMSELHDKINEIRRNKLDLEIKQLHERTITWHGVSAWSLHFTKLIDKYSHHMHHINNKFISTYGANLPRAISAKILLTSKRTTNMGVHIRQLKMPNKIKMLLLLFNFKTFILDLPRLVKAAQRTIFCKFK